MNATTPSGADPSEFGVVPCVEQNTQGECVDLRELQHAIASARFPSVFVKTAG